MRKINIEFLVRSINNFVINGDVEFYLLEI